MIRTNMESPERQNPDKTPKKIDVGIDILAYERANQSIL